MLRLISAVLCINKELDERGKASVQCMPTRQELFLDDDAQSQQSPSASLAHFLDTTRKSAEDSWNCRTLKECNINIIDVFLFLFNRMKYFGSTTRVCHREWQWITSCGGHAAYLW